MSTKIIHNPFESNIGTVILRCDDNCSMLVIDKYKWEHFKSDDINYDITIQDNHTKNYFGFIERIKHSVKVLFGKPYYIGGIYIDGNDTIVKFKDALNELIEKE